MKIISLFLLKLYKKYLSPFLPPACRFYPTCSDYCAEAINKYGFFKGMGLGIRRLLRCHPWNTGGYDPLP